MSREQLRRIARLVELRDRKLQIAQSEAARAARAADEARQAAEHAEAHFDTTAAEAVVSGDFTRIELEESREFVVALRRRAEVAARAHEHAVRESVSRRAEVERAHVAVRQMETLAETVQSALADEERRLDRVDTDELASRLPSRRG
jgi:hypothetical protein